MCFDKGAGVLKFWYRWLEMDRKVMEVKFISGDIGRRPFDISFWKIPLFPICKGMIRVKPKKTRLHYFFQ
jgi:hypothetical protein